MVGRADIEIDRLLAGLLRGEPLSRSVALQAIAEEVVQQSAHRLSVDIEQWAKRLANDVAQATD